MQGLERGKDYIYLQIEYILFQIYPVVYKTLDIQTFSPYSRIRHLGFKTRLDGHEKAMMASGWNMESYLSKSLKYLPKTNLDFAEKWVNENA